MRGLPLPRLTGSKPEMEKALPHVSPPALQDLQLYLSVPTAQQKEILVRDHHELLYHWQGH
jgi:hypothetical protein